MNKRILLITSEFPPQPGGIGNHAYHLALSLNEKGYLVTVLVDARTKSGTEENTFDGSLPFLVQRVKRKKIIFISYLVRFIKAFSISKKSDVVICSGKFSLWMGGILSVFYSKKYIAVLHGSELLLPNSLLKKYTHFCLRKFDSVVAVSQFTLNLVADLALKNTRVIPNGFYLPETTFLSEKPTDSINLITVGNVTQRKGQHNVIHALPELLKHFPNLHYYIVGIPTAQKALSTLAASLGVKNHVSFLGKVTEEDKIAALQRATIFVMLSETTTQGAVEGFGIAILEANALGIPAIGALGCGIEDAIKDGYSGRLVSLGNTPQLCESIQDILQQYPIYTKNAKAWSQNFTWDKVITAYIQVIENE